ncbi:hypothetical protein GCM10009665_49130 [Kitasatospora nipponensis]|uniref:Secreted protein n=1 Tax=Kitasatospora nipponensis TaxID=258049 RepID=A0ABN1WJQ1_9ACTN
MQLLCSGGVCGGVEGGGGATGPGLAVGAGAAVTAACGLALVGAGCAGFAGAVGEPPVGPGLALWDALDEALGDGLRPALCEAEALAEALGEALADGLGELLGESLGPGLVAVPDASVELLGASATVTVLTSAVLCASEPDSA